MAESLLKELSNADIDWMFSVGKISQVAVGTTIIQANECPDKFYIILDGEVVLSGRAKGETTSQELIHLGSSDVLGVSPLFKATLPFEAKAATDVRLFSLSQDQLAVKLAADVTFKAHLYRAIALILSDRLRKIYATPDQLRFANNQAAKEAMVVFGELRDSDIDWLISVGKIKQYSAPDDFLVQAGRPVEALYIVLRGQFAVHVFQGSRAPDPISVCFECPYKMADTMKVVTNLSKGQMAGTIAFLDFQPHLFSIRTTDDAMVLRIPRPQLAAKLLQDMDFSARFHRILGLQLLDLLQTSMGHGEPDPASSGGTLGEIDGEIDMESLEHASQGAVRFNWMLKQLGTMS
ncbi:MAG: cyclic nucleotide-binding domain-containing protein [Leptolyngbyaceae bacterium]|nr:cyclic nucleotide-binding domain-containing protein [Leptolyngbyaceae bacterium]